MGSSGSSKITMVIVVLLVLSWVGLVIQNNRIAQLGQEMREKEIELSALESELVEQINTLKLEQERFSVIQGASEALISVIQNVHESQLEEILLETKNRELELKSIIDNQLRFAVSIGYNLTDPTVEPRKTSFHIGDTITFDIESKYPLDNSSITIWDSNGTLVWEMDPLID